ncbi:hypothetical protein, partial [Polymorphospora rubra]|uniref:hypothetical protein n=1 Tax=Polymorphospora rubra TaxID=338584 RepID=UPI0031DF7C26
MEGLGCDVGLAGGVGSGLGSGSVGSGDGDDVALGVGSGSGDDGADPPVRSGVASVSAERSGATDGVAPG